MGRVNTFEWFALFQSPSVSFAVFAATSSSKKPEPWPRTLNPKILLREGTNPCKFIALLTGCQAAECAVDMASVLRPNRQGRFGCAIVMVAVRFLTVGDCRLSCRVWLRISRQSKGWRAAPPVDPHTFLCFPQRIFSSDSWYLSPRFDKPGGPGAWGAVLSVPWHRYVGRDLAIYRCRCRCR